MIRYTVEFPAEKMLIKAALLFELAQHVNSSSNLNMNAYCLGTPAQGTSTIIASFKFLLLIYNVINYQIAQSSFTHLVFTFFILSFKSYLSYSTPCSNTQPRKEHITN